MIFQLIDDRSRYAIASHVAWTETAESAITVFDKAVAAHGVPQRLLSDNGVALKAQVDALDYIYNTDRPHQGLPGRITPLTAWEATEKADHPARNRGNPSTFRPPPDASSPHRRRPTYPPAPPSGD